MSKRFDDLPEHTKDFIVGLDDQKVTALNQLIDLWHTVQGWCRVTRWLFFGAVALIVAIAQGYDAIKSLLGFKH